MVVLSRRVPDQVQLRVLIVYKCCIIHESLCVGVFMNCHLASRPGPGSVMCIYLLQVLYNTRTRVDWRVHEFPLASRPRLGLSSCGYMLDF